MTLIFAFKNSVDTGSRPAVGSSSIKTLVEGYFEGSFSDVVSFMVKQKDLKVSDLELLLQEIKKKKFTN